MAKGFTFNSSQLIDDTTKSKATTYSSDKIEDLIGKGGGGADAKLSEDITSNTACGAAPASTLFKKDTEFTEFAKMLLIKEIAPTITFSATNSGLQRKGTTVNSTVLKVVVNSVGTGTPTSIEFYSGSTLLDTQSYIAGTSTYQFTSSDPITSNLTVKGVLIYDKADGTSSSVNVTKQFTFVDPSFYGSTVIDQATITDVDVSALFTTLSQSKGFTYNSVNANDEYVVYAYPKSYGALSSIKDANGFDATASFNRSTLTINSVDYYVYETKNKATLSGYKYIFA